MRLIPEFTGKYAMLRRLWVSRFFNANGSGIGQFAIKWIATAFPHPAIALAYTNTLGTLSQVFSNYLVGWLADNVSPVSLIILGNLLGALFAVVMGLLLHRFHVILLLVVLVLLWSAVAVTSNASSAKLIPQWTERHHLPKVNSWMASIPPLQQFLSNGLAGILVAASIMHAFLAAALAMALAALPMMTARKGTTVAATNRKRRNIAVGISLVISDPLLRGMVICVSLLNFGYSFYLGEYLLYLRFTDHLSALEIGMGLTIATVGTVVSLLMGPFLLKRFIRVTILVTPALMSLGIVVVTLWTGMVGFTIGFALVELGSGLSGQYVSLIRQRSVPLETMGSVAGALWMFQTILVPLGMALAGIVATKWGAGVSLYISGVLVLASLVPSYPLATTVGRRFRAENQ